MRKLEVKLSRLGQYEEAVGVLHAFEEDSGMLIARISRVILALPSDMEDRLRPFLGKRIAILRTDIPGKEYLVRTISEQMVEEIGVTAPIAPAWFDMRPGAYAEGVA